VELVERSHGWQPATGRPAGRDVEELTLEVKHANDVLRQLTLPWDELFQAVESAAGKKIALLALEPDTEKTDRKNQRRGKRLCVAAEIHHETGRAPMSSALYICKTIRCSSRTRISRCVFRFFAVWRGNP